MKGPGIMMFESKFHNNSFKIMFLRILFTLLNKKLICKLIIFGTAIPLLIFLIHPGRFATYKYDCISIDHIKYHLSPSLYHFGAQGLNQTKFCEVIIDKKLNEIRYPQKYATESELLVMASQHHILPGGTWKPADCISKFQVAIVIPFRDRDAQLNVFLSYMHPFLQQQMLDYRIVIVEQTSMHQFNRAKLFNIGFVETVKIFPYHCFIFHDVDLIPQSLNNIYACTHHPRHMSSSLNTFRYNLPYKDLFGGAVSILKYQFEEINGFSNSFFGWGGEDDDLKNRISNKGLQINRFSPDVARYVMLAHRKELPSQNRFQNLKAGRERYGSDGLNNLNYDVLKLENRSLYTWILVNVVSSELKNEK